MVARDWAWPFLKQLVNLMGGSIGVDSRSGEGSTFWFELPLQLNTQPNIAPPPVAGLAGLRVLILGDNEVKRRVLDEQVASRGMRPGSLGAIEQAMQAMCLAQVAGDPYHFVLLDCPMRDGGEAAFARAIRSDPSLRGCAIVMSSSIRQCQEISHNLDGIIDAFLNRPAHESHLFSALASVWIKRQGATPPRNPDPEAKPKTADLRQTIEGTFSGYTSRILVAEDNVVNQKVACGFMECLGLRADVAANGRDAVGCTILR